MSRETGGAKATVCHSRRPLLLLTVRSTYRSATFTQKLLKSDAHRGLRKPPIGSSSRHLQYFPKRIHKRACLSSITLTITHIGSNVRWAMGVDHVLSLLRGRFHGRRTVLLLPTVPGQGNLHTRAKGEGSVGRSCRSLVLRVGPHYSTYH